MFLSERSERNQWPRPPSLAPLGQFTLRCAGAAFDERLRAAGAHRRLAPDPAYEGLPPENLALASGGFEHKTMRSSCPGDTGPYPVKI